jgi:hypothetical protein
MGKIDQISEEVVVAFARRVFGVDFFMLISR